MNKDFTDIWTLNRPGAQDSVRHKQRIRKAIKDNLHHLISGEDIITSDGSKKVKIPMRYLDMWRFKFGKNKKYQGVGHGDGNPGDILGRDGQGKKGNKAGDQEGEDLYEEEISVDELIEMMLEDLNLPFLEDKQNAVEIETEETVFQDIAERGLPPNIDKKRTIIENMKRNALKGKVRIGGFDRNDLRYRVWEQVIEKHSNAAVFLLMDRSGSMTDEKRYIVKSFFWWMVRFLEKKYNNVELVFIAHDTAAREVEEKDFFSIADSGGTKCSSAFKLAYKIVEDRYSPSIWNNYVFEFSDGDNWGEDNNECVKIVKDLLKVCRAVGYGEVKYDDWFYDWKGEYYEESKLSHAFRIDPDLSQDKRFISSSIDKREEVYKCLKAFLQGIDE